MTAHKKKRLRKVHQTEMLRLTVLLLSAAALLAHGWQNIQQALRPETLGNLLSAEYDVVVFLNDDITGLGPELKPVEDALRQYTALDPSTVTRMQVVPFLEHPSKRMIFAPTGKLNTDISDSRQIYDTAKEAAKLVYSLRLRKPLFILGPLVSGTDAGHSWLQHHYPRLLLTLGALQGFYMPLVLREDKTFSPKTKYDILGICGATNGLLKIIAAIETGRIVTRDVCAAGPQRMPPPAVEEYYKSAFSDPDTVQVTYFPMDKNRWPMCAGVNRAVEDVEAYQGRIIKMRYRSTGEIKKTVLFVGKGVTYDTGGSELKTGGNMKYMRKDKCGAAAIAGFMKTVEILKPTGFIFSAHLAFVRNGIGANAYVFDEIWKLKSGLRTRIGGPDAEGRNIMTDMMFDAVTEARLAESISPHIFTVATLTGAVGRSFKHFTAILDNGPARKEQTAQKMEVSGYNIADFVEVNNLRREDYEVNRPSTDDFDILQFNNAPDTSKYRGFQLPAGFMATASGLDYYGLQPEGKPIAYTHLDCSASVGVKYIEATAAPTSLFISHYLLPQYPEFGAKNLNSPDAAANF